MVDSTPLPLLSIDSVTLIRQGRILLHNLSFTLLAGETMILQGANGCGKTTLLKAICGLYSLGDGSIKHQGNPVSPQDQSGNVLFLGHRNGLKEEATVIENLNFRAEVSEKKDLLPAAMHFFSLEAYAHVPVGQLSAGWQRRTALARLFLSDARLWLLDEPYANLDVEGQALLSGMIRTRTESGGAVILSSHGTFVPKESSGIKFLNLHEYKADATRNAEAA